MNRTERLHALTGELRRAGARGRTSGQLAAALEVSVRTVKRDVEALGRLGVPVAAAPGRGGGYRLAERAHVPPLALTDAEAAAVALALELAPPGVFAADARSALAKVLQSMRPETRDRAATLAARVWLYRSATVDGAPAGSRPAVSRVLAEVLRRCVVVVVDYEDAAGRRTHREVEPILLAHTARATFLVGWCRLRRDVRWFRADRIVAATATNRPAPVHDPALVGTPPAGTRPVQLAQDG